MTLEDSGRSPEVSPEISTHTSSKSCLVCGRTIEWRKRWQKNWDSVKYCSDHCRRSIKSLSLEYDKKILALLAERPAASSICPSEVLPPELKQNKFEMEKVRQAARRLVQKGKVEIMQGGQVVDPSGFKGPIRLRKKIADIPQLEPGQS